MKRVPVLATLVVALAVAAMIALGVWQLRRAQWKEALLARYAHAAARAPAAFPLVPASDALLYRRAEGFCLQVVGWTIEAGTNRDGESGWRHLAHCRTGAEGPGMTVDAGWSSGFAIKPSWRGGKIAGVIGPLPQHASLLAVMSGGAVAVPGLLLVADVPAPGLRPSAFPSIAHIPNNHRAYAVQWFLFAGLAALIYGIALWRRPDGARR